MISMRSRVAKELLNYFFLHPEARLFVNEISRKLGLDKRNLAKKLKELEEEGILKSESLGNRKIYSIDRSFPLLNEYRRIAFKTIGIESKLRDALKEVDGVEKVYLFGSYAKNDLSIHSDIDLLVIGEHRVVSLQKEINKLQKKMDREINVVNMDKKEFDRRRRRKDAFIETVLREKHIEVI